MDRFLTDLRRAGRNLHRHAGTSLLVILALGLGIGVNSVVFSGVHALLLDPLPFDGSERLVLISEVDAQGNEMGASVPDFVDWQVESRLLPELGGFLAESFNSPGRETPERIEGAWISASVLAAFGVQVEAGRLLGAADDEPGAPPVAVVRRSLWERRFGGEALGEQWITLDQRPFRVVGVLPPELPFPDETTEVWLPLGQALPLLPQERGARGGLQGLGKLPEGVSLGAARAEMEAIARRLAAEYPDTNRDVGVRLVTLRERAVGEGRPFLLLLAAAVILVLAIACLNVASLLMARMTERRKEIAIQSALGAGSGALSRQLLVESALLGLLGGAVGVLLARWGLDVIAARLPPEVAVRERLVVDGTVLLFTAAVALGTGILCGLAPALGAARVDLRGVLSEGEGRSGGLARRGVRNTLVIVELAVALTVLTGAALAIRSAVLLSEIDLGLAASEVLTLRVAPDEGRYADLVLWQSFVERMLGELETLPGVRAVGMASGLPLVGGGGRTWTYSEESPPVEGEPGLLAVYQVVSPGYFPALGLELRSGRLPRPTDRVDAPRMVVVDERLADRLWPGESPLGRRFAFEIEASEAGPRPLWREVAGVVAAVSYAEPEEEPPPAFYVPYTQPPTWYAGGRPPLTVVVRAAGDPLDLAAPVRRRVASLDADQPIYRVATLAGRIDEELVGRRLTARLMGAFAVLALVLALVGVYGILSFAVAQRRHETAVRMALGALPGRVLWLVLRQALLLVAVGLGIGLAASAALGKALAGVLYGITGLDPWILLGATALLAAAAVAASYLPARSATRVDPIRALRGE